MRRATKIVMPPVAALGLALAAASASAWAAPAEQVESDAGRYFNLHQCAYYSDSAKDLFTTVLPSRQLPTGTNVSNTIDATARCAAVVPPYVSHTAFPGLSGVAALDLTAGRYLNIHQCSYDSPSTGDILTTVLPGRELPTGTNVSNTIDTTAKCAALKPPYTSHRLHLGLTGVATLDLSAGRFINWHQCAYYSDNAKDLFTTMVPVRDLPTGTNVSNTADTSARCTAPKPPYTYHQPHAALIGVFAGSRT
ncbi:hypothetical protein OHR68_36480 [Spirillospora sp. NBC_00431]